MNISFGEFNSDVDATDILKVGALGYGAYEFFSGDLENKKLERDLKKLQIAQMKRQLGDSYTDSNYDAGFLDNVKQVGYSRALETLADDSMLDSFKQKFLNNIKKGSAHVLTRKFRF